MPEKLSELVAFRLEIQKLAALSLEIGAKEAAAINEHIAALSNQTYNDRFIVVNGIISDSFIKLRYDLKHHFTLLLNEIDDRIAKKAKVYAAKDYTLFATNIQNDREVRVLPLQEPVKEMLLGRIRLLTDWHYPGLEISPHDGEFTPFLVGCDPLYLIDIFQEYLDSAASQFNEQYQARLRTYLTSIGGESKYLSALPQGQFGFVLSWNNFNYLPLYMVAQYLKEVFDVLRPGGTFLFSFNDASMTNGAKHVEWGGMAYMTKAEIVKIVKSIGYEISYSYSKDSDWHNISWLEIKKPGVLSTVKAHQTLGLIKDIL